MLTLSPKPKARRIRLSKMRRFAQPFPHMCGELLVRNSPRAAVRKKSNTFDIFLPREVNSSLCAAIVRIELNFKHPIKIHGILTCLQ